MDDIQDKFKNLLNTTLLFKKQLKELEKLVNADFKKLTKKINKQTKDKSKRTPSGFAKPTKVSEELCLFMNLQPNTLVARTTATKFITQYIKNNNLNTSNIVIPDDKLKKLLDIHNPEIQLTFFTLQKYLNKLFVQ